MGSRWFMWMSVVMISMLVSCRSGEKRRAAVVSPVVEVPQRTAAASADMRALATDLVAGRACEEIDGAIYPLRKGGPDSAAGEQPVTGRLWLDRCQARRRPDGIALELGGRGWRWIERKSEELGATFTVDQYVGFTASFDVVAAVDVAYAEEEHLLHLWLTPTEPIRALIEPIGDIDVRTPSAWSSALGWAADVLPMDSMEQRAGDQMSRKGSKEAASALKRGYSVVVDLCTGERHTRLGVIAEGEVPGQRGAPQEPAPAPGTRVRLYPHGMDLAGPFRADRHPLVAEIEVLEGPGVDARMVCRDDARRAVDAFLAGQPLPALAPRAAIQARGNTPVSTMVEADCELMLLARPSPPDQGVTFRVHVSRFGVEREDMLACTRDEQGSGARE